MNRKIRIAIAASMLCASAALIETAPLRVNTTAVIAFTRWVPGEYRVLMRLSGEISEREAANKAVKTDSEDLQVELPAAKLTHLSLEMPGIPGEVRIRGVKLVKMHRRVFLSANALRAGLIFEKDVSDPTIEEEELVFQVTGPAPSLSFRDPTFASFNVIGRGYLYAAALWTSALLYVLLGMSFGGWWKYRELVWNITRMNLSLKYRGSFLGFLWSLLNPVMMIVIYSIAFRYIIRIELENYTLFLLAGLLPFNFVSVSAVSSTVSVVGNAALLKKVKFPRESFPISATLFCFLQFLLALAAFTPFILAWKTGFALPNLLYFVPVALMLLMVTGFALALSSLTVHYRDIQHFTEVGMLGLFWVTPVIYNFEMIPCDYRWVFMLNPCTVFVIFFHDVLYWNRYPDALIWIGVIIWPLTSLTLGSYVFRRLSPKFAEVL